MDLRDENGRKLIASDGGLPPPQMNEKTVSSIVATGIMVAEQIMMQYMVPGAALYPDGEFLAVLQKIEHATKTPGLARKLLAKVKPIMDAHAKVGRQCEDCNEILQEIRLALQVQPLIEAIRQGNLYECLQHDHRLQETVAVLREVGMIMQEYTFTCCHLKKGNGLMAGLDPLLHAVHYTSLRPLQQENPGTIEHPPLEIENRPRIVPVEINQDRNVSI
jgi:hypothetical protein